MEGHPFQVEPVTTTPLQMTMRRAIFGYGVLSMGDIIIGIEQRLLARYSDEYGGTFKWKQFDSIEDAKQLRRILYYQLTHDTLHQILKGISDTQRTTERPDEKSALPSRAQAFWNSTQISR